MFGADKKDAKKVGKDARKEISSGQRDIERQIRELQRAEDKAVAEARLCAKKGDMAGARTLAQEVVRLRNGRQRMTHAKSQLSSVSLRTQEMEAVHTQVQAMQKAGSAMHAANSQLDVKQMQGIVRAFEQQSGMADLKTEMLDDLFDNGEMDEEADEAVGRIFEELSIETTEKLGAAPRHVAVATPARQETEDDVMREIAALK